MSVETISNSAFRLKWRRTWEPGTVWGDPDDDFYGTDPESPVGYCRVFVWHRAEGPKWSWSANARVHIASGWAETAREAAYAAELAYFKAKERKTAKPG